MIFVTSSDLRSKLKSELKRTSFDLRRLKLRGDVPAGLTVRHIRRWVRNVDEGLRQDYLDYLLCLLSQMPDYEALSRSEAHAVKPQRRIPPSQGDWIALTPNMHDQLLQELKRTGLSLTEIARRASKSLPDLTAGKLLYWKKGAAQTVNPDLWNYLMKILADTPDRDVGRTYNNPPIKSYGRPDYKPLTGVQVDELKRQRMRTGISGYKILGYADDVPDGLDGNMIGSWMQRATRSARLSHYDFVLRLYRIQPDA